ncbi:MAG: NTP transferase domain-containing protein [Candidatus Micrarchaeota archaeon]|nr:NTP transferase domain-containing protein [Candidatus Micrarchaeota archaeon]MDE1834221.1 NTP transferase domain-containing protein [Candidatus Micrarchaeota archaeon]MDE1859854.1 NTP transferase domain-containing protein [Candidatus Micrarchaeota archaeon]
MGKIRKVVIPAAGLGTRLYPLTRGQPKEMLPIVDKPVIHYVVEEAVKAGIEEILIIIGRGKESVINYFDSNNFDSNLDREYGFDKFPEIFFVRQKEPKGLADAINCARGFVGEEPFLVLLGDTIYTTQSKDAVAKQLVKAFESKDAPIIAVEKIGQSEIKYYGIIDGKKVSDRLWLIKDAVEKPDPKDAPSNMGIAGAYVLTSDIFNYIDRLSKGKNGEYQLTDALKAMAKETEVYGYEFEGRRYDIGTKERWIDAFIEFAKGDKKFHSK